MVFQKAWLGLGIFVSFRVRYVFTKLRVRVRKIVVADEAAYIENSLEEVRVRFALLHCLNGFRGIMHVLPASHTIVRDIVDADPPDVVERGH